MSTDSALQQAGNKNAGMLRSLSALVLILTGGSSIIYQLAWTRLATITYGAPHQAVSLVLLIFFAGLAIGNYVFGRIAAKNERPARLFGILQIVAGILAIASPTLMEILHSVYASSYAAYLATTTMTVIKGAVISVAVLPAAVLLGGTLPLVARQFVTDHETIARPISRIYALQAIGMGFATAAFGLYLLPQLGLDLTLLIAGATSIVAGVVMAAIPSHAPTLPPMPEPEVAEDDEEDEEEEGQDDSESAVSDEAEDSQDEDDEDDDEDDDDYEYEDEDEFELSESGYRNVVSAMFFLSGFVVLGSQLLWLRFLPLLTQNTPTNQLLMWSIMFIGFGVGSFLTGGIADRSEKRVFIYSVLQILVAICLITIMSLQPTAWTSVANPVDLSGNLLVVALLVLLPSLLMGLTIPLGARMAIDYAQRAPSGIGQMLAFRNAGVVFGAWLVGFFFMSYIAMSLTLKIVSGFSLLIGVAGLFLLDRSIAQVARAVVLVVMAAVWILIPQYVLNTTLPIDYLDQAVWDEKGTHGHLSVTNQNDPQLEYDRVLVGKLRRSDQVMTAHVASLLHPAPKQVLVLGIGAGQMPQRFLYKEYEIDELTIVEIERNLITSLISNSFFEGKWINLDQVNVVYDDGRSYLRYIDRKFDIITGNMTPMITSADRYYSEEFYEIAKSRLNENGLFCQALPIGNYTTESFQRIFRAFHDVFPHTVLWYNASELILVGSPSEVKVSWNDRLSLLQSSEEIKKDLDFAHWGGRRQKLNDPAVFLSSYLMGSSGLQAVSEDATPVRDSVPILQFEPAAAVELSSQRSLIDLLEANRGALEELLTKPEEINNLIAHRIDQLRHYNVRHLLARQYLLAARQALTMNQFDTAIGAFQQARELLPNYYEAYEGAGEVFRRLAQQTAQENQAASRVRTDLAIQELSKAVAINPRSSTAQMMLGFQYQLVGNAPQAVVHLRAAIASDEQNPTAISGLARLLASHPDPSIRNGREAVELVTRALSIVGTPHPGLLDIYGMAYAANGQFEEAIKWTEQAAKAFQDAGEIELASQARQRIRLYLSGNGYVEAQPTSG